MLDEKMKATIDGMSYEAMLRKWRFAPVGDPMFRNDDGSGAYFAEVMKRKGEELGDAGRVKASKEIGWE